MIEYGYIENGYLRSKEIETVYQNYTDDKTGEVKQKAISVEEQIAMLSPEWKPVDPVDEEKLNTDMENYFVRIIPYDAGDRISYRYVEVPDIQKFRKQIATLKDELAASDYKIIKCYEAYLVGEILPYNVQQIHYERQSIRDQINSLEQTRDNLLNL